MKKVNQTDAYALSLLGLIPKRLRKIMYNKYFGRLGISPETTELIKSQLNQEDKAC